MKMITRKVPQLRNRSDCRSRIAIYVAILVCFFSIAGFAAASDPYIVFKAIEPRSSSETSVKQWKTTGLSQDAAEAVHAYAKTPNAATGMGILEYYNDFAGDKNQAAKYKAIRELCFKQDPQLFQSIDALKYEIVMRTQKRLAQRFAKDGGIESALRVGSSAERHKAWLKWARGGKNMDAMPLLDSNKQFSSDDDITNFPDAKKGEADPTLAERLNGKTAAEEFVKASIELGFKKGLDPRSAQIEFLSPTKTFDILMIQHPGEFAPVKPNFMAEWTSSDQEKYNGLFAVEQLHAWALQKGVITTNVDDPQSSTVSYAKYAKAHNDPDNPKGFTDHGLFAWMANNNRQIFETHEGDLTSLSKYTARMIAAWRVLGLDPPKGDAAMYEMAEKIYNPPEGFSPPADALEKLKKYNKALIVKAHTQNLAVIKTKLVAAIRERNKNRPTDRGLNFEAFDLKTLVATDEDLRKSVNSLAVAYSNINDDMIQELEIEIVKKINETGDISKQGTPPEYTALISKHILKTLEIAKTSAAASRTQIDAFSYLRNELDQQVNKHITDVNQRLNLDTYLLKVANLEFADHELRLDLKSGRPILAKRAILPDDVATDMRRLEALCSLFGWKEVDMAAKAKNYFEAGDPEIAVRMVKLLREMGEVATAKPVIISYTDADGKTVTKKVKASVYKTGANAGFLAFKAALAGWKIWGDAADGKALYENLVKFTSGAGKSPEELATVQSQILANAINLSEYGNINVMGGNYLASLATMAGNNFMDDKLYTNLAQVLFQDLTVMYQPHLAYAYAVHGIASWGWDKYSLSASKGEIFKFFLENGIWQYFDENGKKTDDPAKRDLSKTPELIGYVKWDGKDYIEKVLDKNAKELAKILSGKVKDGIMLITSKYKVDPRLSLMDIAYKSGYIAQDKMIDIDTKAITGVFNYWSIINLPLILANSSYWTKQWLEDYYGVLVPTKEDAIVISGKKERLIQIASGSQQGWGTWAATWVDGVRFGVMKNLGYLMQDFWVKRQVLLEQVVLPAVIKEAAQQKMKESIQNVKVEDYLAELDKLKKRMIELDKRVWKEIARSADPFIDVGYRPEKDIPITDQWWESIKPQRDTLEKCVKWLETNKNLSDEDANAIVKKDFPESYLEIVKSYYRIKSYLGYGVTVETKDDVPKLARYTIGDITDTLLKHEKVYDGILKTLDDTKKLVKKQGKGLDVFEYHVHLKPIPISWFGASTPADNSEKVYAPSDVAAIASNWQGKWKEEPIKVSADIGAILIKMGFKPPGIPEDAYNWTDPIRKTTGILYNWWSSNGDVKLVPSHPLWKDCVQLRLQIHKLQNMLGKPEEISKNEFNKPISQMVFKKIESDKKDNANSDNSKKIVNVPVGVTAGKPFERGEQIKKLIKEMEEDYQKLLELVNQLFEVKLDISPSSGFHLGKEITVSISTAAPKLHGMGTGDLTKQIENYRYEIYGLEPGVSAGDLIVNEVIKEKSWKHHLSASGKQKLKVQILGKDHIPLSVTEYEFSADPAFLHGELIIHGDFKAPPPVTIKFGKDPSLEHIIGDLDTPGNFKFKIKRVNDNLFDPPKDDKPAKPLLSMAQIDQISFNNNMSYYGTGISTKTFASSNKSKITQSANIFNLDKPLELRLPVTVTIDVKVTDCTDTEVTADITAYSTSQTKSSPNDYIVTDTTSQTVTTPDDLIVSLNDQDSVSVKAERKKPLPGVFVKSKESVFDVDTMQHQMDFEVQLPFFEEGNLTVEGTFVTDSKIVPIPVFEDGTMWSNISKKQAVGADGTFSFINTRSILFKKSLMIYGVMYSKDGRAFKPKGGVYKTVFKKGKVRKLGNIELEPVDFLTIGAMKVTSPDGKGKPVMGKSMKATAQVVVGKYEGPLVIEWKRMSDNKTETQTKDHVTQGQSFELDIVMAEVPKNMRTKDDVLELYISDGIDHEVRKTVAFTWETGDEFLKPFQYTSVKKGKRGTKFVIGEKITVQGAWKIAKDNGKKRTLVYYAGGSEFFREDIIVPKGQRFTHSTILDTLGLKKGLLEIKADMINSEHKLIATGIGKIHMVEPKDVIIAAGAGASTGTVGNRSKFTQGNKVFITGVVQAAEGKDGLRTLHLKYRGRVVLTEQFEMKGDEKLSRSFQINSDKLSAKNHVFALELYDDEPKRQDREIVRLRLAKKQKKPNAGSGQGGLQNVACTGDTVSIKVWDHSSQDGDIITLTLAGKPVLSYFNMGWNKKGHETIGCGGSEPSGPPCAFMNLPFPAGTKVAVSVTAHNQGDGGPNTAALKVEGDCTPEVQYWNLKTGETSSIFISRVEAPQQQGGKNGSTGKPENGKPGNQASGTQPSVQSWP